jgi:putative transcriptional regulator
MASIKTRLSVLRAEREWSQAKLAAVVGVTRQTINSIEKGWYHPNLRLALKIARAFGKLVDEVFLYEDHPSFLNQ